MEKKEVKLANNLTDKIESYSEFGFNLRPGLVFKKWSVHLLGGYSSTTDYNTANQHFERKSDKGFAYVVGSNFKWNWFKNSILEADAYFTETNFNSIEEDPTRDVEYEIENYVIALRCWYKL